MKWDNFELNSCKCTFIRQKTGTTITINYSRNEAFRSFLAAQEPVAGGYFIASPAGSPYSSFNRMWHKAIEAAQVNAFKFKEIRHLANSVLNAEGIPVYERMKMTGHKSISVNERYTHDQGMETVRAGEILGRFGNV